MESDGKLKHVVDSRHLTVPNKFTNDTIPQHPHSTMLASRSLIGCIAAVAVLALTVSSSFITVSALPIPNPPSPSSSWTALQDYVWTDDGYYNWTYLSTSTGLGYSVDWLNMTSQQWLTGNDSDRSIWWHYVAVIVPSNLNPEFGQRGLMYVTGGKNSDTSVPSLWSEDMIIGATLAQKTGTVTTILFQIPNQPIVFTNDPGHHSRQEDNLIAYTWNEYMKDTSANTEWIIRLPMVKAALRAMDASTEYMNSVYPSGSNNMTEWIVAGASKRGWVTWLVGACNPERVTAIIPMVLDELNFISNIHHQWRAYGGWSWALQDYVHQNITTQFDSPEFAQMMQIVDPIMYTEVLTMPKLILSTGGDEFLMPDNNDWYWSSLVGEKHFHQFPNLEHTMIENIPLVLETIEGFINLMQNGQERPDYSWEKDEETGRINVVVNNNNLPSSVSVWSAVTTDAKRRDFRLVTLQPNGKPGLHLVLWSQQNLTGSSNETHTFYSALLTPPSNGGWIGFNIQLVFPNQGASEGSNFRVSTATSILPQTFPFQDCYLETCAGPMV